jgi:hypothetical protein
VNREYVTVLSGYDTNFDLNSGVANAFQN